jgi:hypothetical protein
MFQFAKNLTPRAIVALSVVATTAFLAVCVLRVGASTFADPNAAQSAGLVARFVGSLVTTLGAGLWVFLLLPMAWGAIVYFDERTPDLLLRAAGTIVLAVATATFVGLCGGQVWSGQIGSSIANALAPDGSGWFRIGIAFLLDLALFFASFVFATDWVFHTLRRAGSADAEETQPIAVEPPAELREETSAPEPREFVVETPRAAVAAAAIEEISNASSDEVETPSGWTESEDDGRRVIVAPSGYRGVEFLPPSDELALPEYLQAPRFEIDETTEADASPAAPATPFEDQHFVTTSDAAYFVETPSGAEAEAASDESDDEEVVAEAVQDLFEAVTTPEAAAPAGGIGLPDDSPFLDEFFAADAGWPYAAPAEAANDGASAAAEMASRYVAPPAPTAPAPEPVAADDGPSFEDVEVSIDEILVSRLPADAFDDVAPLAEQVVPDAVPETMPEAPVVEATEPETISAPIPEPIAQALPEPIAEPVVEAIIETPEIAPEPEALAPQLSLFSEPVAPAAATAAPAAAVATLPSIDLARLHAMELDPLFHDAVDAVLERERASAVVLQRQLGIGYARGIRILDQMTTAGLVGPDTPTGAREIRVAREAWKSFVGA